MEMRPVYQLDASQLMPGDVILESGDGLFSWLIRRADKGSYSRAILYLGANFIVEAVEQGVRVLQAARVITFHPEHYLVLRHPDAEKLKEKGPELLSFAEQFLIASTGQLLLAAKPSCAMIAA